MNARCRRLATSMKNETASKSNCIRLILSLNNHGGRQTTRMKGTFQVVALSSMIMWTRHRTHTRWTICQTPISFLFYCLSCHLEVHAHVVEVPQLDDIRKVINTRENQTKKIHRLFHLFLSRKMTISFNRMAVKPVCRLLCQRHRFWQN
jgi:hypothetical protein